MPNFVMVYNPSAEATSEDVVKSEMLERLGLQKILSRSLLEGRLKLFFSDDKYITTTTFDKFGVSGGAICAGDVLLSDGGASTNDIRSVSFDIIQNTFSIINRTRGRFCGVAWATKDGKDIVSLYVDRVGTRPLYYSRNVDGQYFIATEALLLAKILGRVSNQVSIRLGGILSRMLLGYVTGVQTCYAEIRILRGATIVTLSAQGAESKRYWRWPEAVASESEIEDLAKRAAEIFLRSLELRLPRECGVVRAFLSGGLDSRLIVGGLRVLGKDLSTYTFSRNDALDMVLAASFAKACGAQHHSTTIASFNLGGGLPYHFRSRLSQEGVSPDEWVGVWSGVGGSGVLGHVDHTETMTRAAHSGDYLVAVREYLRNKRAGIARGLATASEGVALQNKLAAELCVELEGGEYVTNEKKLFHFFIDNMERTHENDNVAKLERTKIDYIEPFYDPYFIEIMFKVPFSICDRHKFFVRMMKHFDPKLLSVPWQAYPGHVESTIPLPEGYTRQWSRRQEPEEKKELRERIVKCLKFVWSKRFPSAPFSRLGSTFFLLVEYQLPERKSGIESQITSIMDVCGELDHINFVA